MKKLNVKLLERIKEHLKEDPRRYHQNSWARDLTGCGEQAPMCNTGGCIGGWAVFLSVPKRAWGKWIRGAEEANYSDTRASAFKGIPLKAKNLLGLSTKEAYQLFTPWNQLYQNGLQGVESAIKKINALIANRRQFAKGYSER